MKNSETVLIIDTSRSDRILLSLISDGKSISKIYENKKTTSQILLGSIEGLLKRSKISIFDLTEVKVKIGPGSFTGLRVGISVANTLGWLLGINVNGKNGNILEPSY